MRYLAGNIQKLICSLFHNNNRAAESGMYYDVLFNVRGVEIKAHKAVLVARCKYFYAMFTGKWRQRKVIFLNHPLVCLINLAST